MVNPMDLTGKHVFITGASSGIGRQCAIQASRLGARVSLTARNEERLRETIGMMERPGEHRYYVFDLQNTEGIGALIQQIVAEQGAVDGFCHAAGIAALRDIKMTKPMFVEKMMRIHSCAFIELIRCLSLRRNLNDGSSLVGISSVAAAKGSAAQTAYAGAKACMNGVIVPISQELAPRNIRVNTVAYGMVDTAMYQDFLSCGNQDMLMSRQLLGVIDLESAANTVMFLLSDACRFITGSVLPVYGGQ